VTSSRGAAEIAQVISPLGAPLAYMKDRIWEFMDLAERLCLTMFECHPASSRVRLTLEPLFVADALARWRRSTARKRRVGSL